MSAEPKILPVGGELPPVESPRPGRKPKRRHSGRFGVLNSLVDFTLRELSRNELATWLVLYRDSKPDGIARTGQGDIGRRIGADPRTVRRALRKLEGRGLVDIVRRGRLGGGPSAYRVRGVPRVTA